MNYSCLKISGEDATIFLQGQLTINVNNLIEQIPQICAYCNHQGKVIAIIYIIKNNHDYLLFLSKDLINLVIKKLKLYILRSKVIINEINCPFYLTFNQNKLTITNQINNDFLNQKIIFNHPEITLETSEKFLPQMLNLHRLNGVSFEKGCYLGQEAIARLQYKTTNHRFLTKTKSNDFISAGTNFYDKNQIAGTILISKKIDKNYLVQAVIIDRFFNKNLSTNNQIELIFMEK